MSTYTNLYVLLGAAAANTVLAQSPSYASTSTGMPTGTGSGSATKPTTSAAATPAAAEGLTPDDFLNLKYTRWLLAILAGIAVIIFVYKLVLAGLRHIRTLACLSDGKQTYFKQPSEKHALLKRHVVSAPLFGKKHTNEMHIKRWGFGILPTRFQSILLAGIIALNVAFCVRELPWATLDTVPSLVVIRNRLGIMCLCNMIPLVLFAGRNNPLIPLLGISFDTYNLMHRWFGRICLAEAVAHTAFHFNKEVLTPGAHGGWIGLWKSFSTSQTIMTGLIAMCLWALIFIQALSAVRHAAYETFLHLHIALVAASIGALYYHIAGTPSGTYLLAVISIWAMERIIRLFRLLYRNVGKGGSEAVVEILPGDAIRLTVTMARPWNFRPGQYMYVTLPTVGIWTSHPFSIAWSEDGSNPKATFMDSEKGFDYSQNDILGKRKTSMSMIVRRRAGFTNTLWNRAFTNPEGRYSTKAFVEGPYGGLHSLRSYGSLVLFAGGVGITHQVPYVRDLLAAYADGTAAVRRILLVWVVQSPEHLEWVRPWMTTILAMERRKEILRIQLFVTRPNSSAEIQSPSSTVQMFPGRPKVDTIVAMETQAQIGAMAVSVCGPGPLGDEVRLAVRKRQGEREIDFVEEAFSW